MNIPQPRFEKKDDYTIRIIIDKIDEVPIAELIKNKEQLIEGRTKMYQAVKDQEIVIAKRIKDIDEILKEARALGIVAQPTCSLCEGTGQVGANPNIPLQCPNCKNKSKEEKK